MNVARPSLQAAAIAAPAGFRVGVRRSSRQPIAGAFRFHDAPRHDTKPFVHHLDPSHQVNRVLLVSGDRESEVRYLAQEVGITEVHAGQTPEQKVAIVEAETKRARTLFIGDGINDAPALMTATVGVAFGPNSDITSEAADVVILTTSLGKVDELFMSAIGCAQSHCRAPWEEWWPGRRHDRGCTWIPASA